MTPVPVQPLREDGVLRVLDVEYALDGVPRAGELLVVFASCRHFEPGAPEWLARALSGCVVRLRFAPTAAAIERDWRASFDRAAAHYLAIEAGLLDRI